MNPLARTIFEDCSEIDFFPVEPRSRCTPASERRGAPIAHRCLPRPAPAAPSEPSEISREEPATRMLENQLRWLKANAEMPAARQLLVSLLNRSAHASHETEVVDAAVRWLGANCDKPAACHVLAALIERRDLGAAAGAIADLAIRWLAMDARNQPGQQLSIDAGLLLSALFAARTLSSDQWQICCDFAKARLHASVTTRSASRLFVALLTQRLSPGDMAEMADLAMTWMELHGAEESAAAIFLPILSAPKLCDVRWLRLAGPAMQWLRGRAYSNVHMSVLRLMARRLKSIDPEGRERIVEEWLGWVSARPPRKDQLQRSFGAIMQIAAGTMREEQVRDLLAAAGVIPVPRHDSPPLFGTELSDRLWTRLQGSGQGIRHVELQAALGSIAAMYAAGMVARAAMAMAPLLPLAARSGDRDLLDEAAELAGTIVEDDHLPQRARRAFLKACRHQVPRWPNQAEAEELVEALSSCG